MIKKYNLKEYKSKNLPTLFVGLYDLKDVISLNAHKGTKYLLWGGNDTNFDVAKFKFNLLGIENLKDINHIAFCDKIYSNLISQYITSKVIKLDGIDLLGKSDLLDAKEEARKKAEEEARKKAEEEAKKSRRRSKKKVEEEAKKALYNNVEDIASHIKLSKNIKIYTYYLNSILFEIILKNFNIDKINDFFVILIMKIIYQFLLLINWIVKVLIYREML